MVEDMLYLGNPPIRTRHASKQADSLMFKHRDYHSQPLSYEDDWLHLDASPQI